MKDMENAVLELSKAIGKLEGQLNDGIKDQLVLVQKLAIDTHDALMVVQKMALDSHDALQVVRALAEATHKELVEYLKTERNETCPFAMAEREKVVHRIHKRDIWKVVAALAAVALSLAMNIYTIIKRWP